jgi:hypothetical protein
MSRSSKSLFLRRFPDFYDKKKKKKPINALYNTNQRNEKFSKLPFIFQFLMSSACFETLEFILRKTAPYAVGYNYENNQENALYRLIYYSKSALHVSGDVFTHHQKHLTVFTVSGSVHASCCQPVFLF